MPQTAEPVVVEVGRYTAPRLRAGSVAGLVAGAVLMAGGVAAGGAVPLVLGLLAGLALVALGIVFAVAANASRGARLVVDARGITWDARAATWHAGWDELSSVGVTVLRSTSRRRGTTVPGSDRVVRLRMAFRRDEPDAGSAPLRRLRTTEEPQPWTHRMPFASRGDGAALLDEGLVRFADGRYAGLEVQEVRVRRAG